MSKPPPPSARSITPFQMCCSSGSRSSVSHPFLSSHPQAQPAVGIRTCHHSPGSSHTLLPASVSCTLPPKGYVRYHIPHRTPHPVLFCVIGSMACPQNPFVRYGHILAAALYPRVAFHNACSPGFLPKRTSTDGAAIVVFRLMRHADKVAKSFTPARSKLSSNVRDPMLKSMVVRLEQFTKYLPAFQQQSEERYLAKFVLQEVEREKGGEDEDDDISSFVDESITLTHLTKLFPRFYKAVSRSQRMKRRRPRSQVSFRHFPRPLGFVVVFCSVVPAGWRLYLRRVVVPKSRDRGIIKPP